MHGGVEWIVDVEGVAPGRVAGAAGRRALRRVFAELVACLDLHPLGDAQWHEFPGTGGITGLVALSESHLACHSYPEAGAVTLNLYTCRARPAPDWRALLEERLGPCSVHVRTVRRGRRAPAGEKRPAEGG